MSQTTKATNEKMGRLNHIKTKNTCIKNYLVMSEDKLPMGIVCVCVRVDARVHVCMYTIYTTDLFH